MISDIWQVARKFNSSNFISGHLSFTKKIQTMNIGWEMSMCYSFNLTQEDLVMIQNPHLSLDQMFGSITNTFEIKRMGVKLTEFYKNTVEIMLLKYISLDQQSLINVEKT